MNLSNYIFNSYEDQQNPYHSQNVSKPQKGLRIATADGATFWNKRNAKRQQIMKVTKPLEQASRPQTREQWTTSAYQTNPSNLIQNSGNERAMSQGCSRRMPEFQTKIQQNRSDIFSHQMSATLKHLKDKVLQIVVLSVNDKTEAQRQLQQLTFLTESEQINRQQPLLADNNYANDEPLDVTQLGTNLEAMQSYLKSQVGDLAKLKTLIKALAEHYQRSSLLSYQQRQRKLQVFQCEKQRQQYIGDELNFFVKKNDQRRIRSSQAEEPQPASLTHKRR